MRSSRGWAASIATPISTRRKLLDARLRLKARAAPALRRPDHRLRGLCRERGGRPASPAASPRPNGSAVALAPPPPTTAIGALLNHITGGHIEIIDAGPRSFQPMNVNFGLFPPIVEPRLDEEGLACAAPSAGVARKRALSARCRWPPGPLAAPAGARRGFLAHRKAGSPHTSIRRRSHPRGSGVEGRGRGAQGFVALSVPTERCARTRTGSTTGCSL